MPTEIVKIRPPKDAAREFLDLVGRCYQENPTKKDLRELRSYLDDKPELYKIVFDLSDVVRSKLIEKIVDPKAAQNAIEINTELMRQDMGFEQAAMLEKLLIDNVINCWLRYQWVEFQLAGYMNKPGVRYSDIDYWERRLSATQRRYLRACETLGRVRKLTRNTPMLQVNIATERGQQVNIAGDLAKREEPR